MPAPAHLDPRLLRAFVTVAEDLHFTRAAARLYVAQQALSRDVRRLERELGAELFVRSTRQVTLTADGERLLPYARRVLQAQDDLLAAFGQARPLLVDLNSPGLVTGRLVLERARRLAPELELMARYESGLTGAAAELLAGRLDASFGRFAGLPRRCGRDSATSRSATSPWRSSCPRTTPWPRCPRCRSPRWRARPCTPGPATRGRRSGPTWDTACSRGAASPWRHPFRWPSGTRSSSGSWTRRAIRSSPW